jgi:riboflavin kinase/FMN adenylyltransferase
MQVYYDINEVDFNLNRAVAIGGFDGIHLGHQKIFITLFIKAAAQNLKKFVITFDPLPKDFFNNKIKNVNDVDSVLLTPIKDKIEIFRQLGIDEVLIIEFNSKVSKLSAYSFTEMLLEKIGFKVYVVGENHTFGNNCEGNLLLLNRLSKKFAHHFEVCGVKSYTENDKVVSSSLIKHQLKTQNIEDINKLLGYNYFIIGEVISGDKIGHQLGFPTANIKVPLNKIIPKNGVYLVELYLWEKNYYGLANIGNRPTITEQKQKKFYIDGINVSIKEKNNEQNNAQSNKDKPHVEIHILDFKGDIYGVELNIRFKQYIRQEQKFTDINELINQITKDIALCKSIINEVDDESKIIL